MNLAPGPPQRSLRAQMQRVDRFSHFWAEKSLVSNSLHAGGPTSQKSLSQGGGSFRLPLQGISSVLRGLWLLKRNRGMKQRELLGADRLDSPDLGRGQRQAPWWPPKPCLASSCWIN